LNVETLETKETETKLLQLKSVLEMYGHFSGINRKVQFKYQKHGKPKNSSSDEDMNDIDSSPSFLLILKWGGECTSYGIAQAEGLGKAFRKLYPGGEGTYSKTNKSDRGFLRLHSTYRHDLKIYASDEGRVQTTAAAFAKGLLALEGELAPILVQMVKSANTNGLLDNDLLSDQYQNSVKIKLSEFLTVDKEFENDDYQKLAPTNNYSLVSALKYIKNPLEMCNKVYMYIKELTNLIRNKITESKYYEIKLYHSETWELMLRRWSKLEKDFYNKKKEKFEISKIPDIYDSIKYDLMHNKSNLNFDNAIELYNCSKALADYVIPQEYGITEEDKLRIAQGIIAPLLHKIRIDLKSNLTGIWNCEDESVNKLNPNYSMGIQTPGRHVRTRLYFTSESHVYSLFNILRYGKLLEVDDESWIRAKEHMNAVPELNYLTQIVIMLYEDTSVDPDSEKRFHIELHFSPGACDYFDESNDAEKNSTIPEEQPQKPPEKTKKFAKFTVSKEKLQKMPASRAEKKSNVSWMKKHFKSFFNSKPLPENSTPIEITRTQAEDDQFSDSKPRSFEDVDHRQFIKVEEGNSPESYHYYNTFHGSATPSTYTHVSSLFSPKSAFGTNSSPDLNQKIPRRTRKDSVNPQELIKVRSIRPLETLHNNLCFNAMNNFLSSMIINPSLVDETLACTSYNPYLNEEQALAIILNHQQQNQNLISKLSENVNLADPSSLYPLINSSSGSLNNENEDKKNSKKSRFKQSKLNSFEAFEEKKSQ
jgi:hypothetical protein